MDDILHMAFSNIILNVLSSLIQISLRYFRSVQMIISQCWFRFGTVREQAIIVPTPLSKKGQATVS